MNYTGEAQNYTTKGQGNLNTVLGAIGTAGVLSNNNGCGNNGGLFGGLFGGNNNNCECYETKEAAMLRTQLSIAQSEKYTSETSRKDMEQLFQELRTQDAKIADGLIQTGNAVGILNAQVQCLQKDVERNREESFRNLNEAKGYTDTRVNCEAQLRASEDEKILVYTDGKLATKVDWSKRISSSLLCDDQCGCNYA